MTRMFNVDPRLLCRQHLLGEHSEMHEGAGFIEKVEWAESQIRGQAKAGNIDTTRLQQRHDDLAKELLHRGYNHDSPLDFDDPFEIGEGCVDDDESLGTLIKCDECRPRLLCVLDNIPRAEWHAYDGGQHTHPPTKWYPDARHPFETELEYLATGFDDERVQDIDLERVYGEKPTL